MKKFIAWLITVAILCTILLYKEEVFAYLLVKIIYPSEFVVEKSNQYINKSDYQYVQNTDNFTPKNKAELMNVFYTILNNRKIYTIIYIVKVYNYIICKYKEDNYGFST